MASSLTPAYIRIAGPSTSHMKFRNSTITIDDATPLVKEDPEKIALSLLTGRKDRRLSIINKQWQKFVHWAKNTGFDVVFALNNAEKTSSGMWDPNGALNILSVAEKANIGDIVWQLGYECTNQSIEEYLNDLETLRVIVETFPPGRSPSWRVVGGDVTPCLQADSKSDFKDYISLSNDMMDAILLNGNSSAQQLERMSESDRRKLLKLLSHSDTPLWLTEKTQSHYDELERAAEWLASLGYSARNGFSMHFRELLEDELHEPTLSFYMALLYKNLVGERVLDVDMTVSRATLFAHCASLRRKPVPGAVTLYGANMGDEPARFSLKLSKREEGGDIMQFIFGRDSSGNIIVNGRAMYLEGDIRPVVKRVRPYKTLLLNLPPKSFGFWVLANTQVEACHYKDESKMETEFIEAIPIEDDNTEEIMNVVKRRRSSIRKRDVSNLDMSFEIIDDDYTGVLSSLDVESKNDALRRQIDSLNNELKNFHELVISKKGQKNDQFPMRFKRQAVDRENRKQSINYGTKSRRSKQMYEKSDFKSNLIDKILQLKNEKLAKLDKGRFSRKNFKRSNTKACSDEDYVTNEEKVSRKRRSVIKEKTLNSLENAMRSKNIKHRMNNVKSIEETSENEIDISEDQFGVGNILHKLKGTLRHLPIEIEENIEKVDDGKEELSSNTNEITLKTKLSDDGAVINISEKTNNGLLKSTYEDLLSLLTDLNKHLNRFWSTFTLLE
ncbi:unnamed protein product [Parnassius apollo]|uniref:(apollo) hypothetical protein n=1 Tax=Parnassius apollo TaxID=110799 RepID=A0A8S3XHS0_PARAO|nr:unnamed protein product [Parnassius apollo]